MIEPSQPLSASRMPLEAPGHRTISSQDLMAGERVIIIRHGQDEYRLRITAAGKLILTK